jgi:hypothetical protein
MIRVGFAVQQDYAWDGDNHLHDRVNFCGIAAFREIGNTLNELARHLLS